MEATDYKNVHKLKGKLFLNALLDVITYSYILLFFYTAISKIITFSTFKKVLSDLPLVGEYYEYVAFGIIFSEMVIGTMLIIPKWRVAGIKASLLLMVIFTLYLGYHILTRSKLPCSCGGVISGMTWQQHLAFNTGFIGLAVTGLHIINFLNKNIHARKQVNP